MTIRPDNTLITNKEMLLELASMPLRAIAELFHKLAENSSRMQALSAIAAVSDQELQSKGLTRADAVSQAFRHDA